MSMSLVCSYWNGHNWQIANRISDLKVTRETAQHRRLGVEPFPLFIIWPFTLFNAFIWLYFILSYCVYSLSVIQTAKDSIFNGITEWCIHCTFIDIWQIYIIRHLYICFTCFQNMGPYSSPPLKRNFVPEVQSIPVNSSGYLDLISVSSSHVSSWIPCWLHKIRTKGILLPLSIFSLLSTTRTGFTSKDASSSNIRSEWSITCDGFGSYFLSIDTWNTGWTLDICVGSSNR